jgi:D-alanyl-D-alanine carboxypeptidase
MKQIVYLYLIFALSAFCAHSQSMQKEPETGFLSVFKNLQSRSGKLKGCNPNDAIQRAVLFEYGAVFISKGAELPEKCLFESARDLKGFRDYIETSQNKLSFGPFFLQPKAKRSLEKVVSELGPENVARNCNEIVKTEIKGKMVFTHSTTKCTNGFNNDWAFRTYRQTKCNAGNCDGLIDLSKYLTEKGKWGKPKLFATAIPGGSQHHFGLAIDVNDDRNETINKRRCGAECENVLKANGWYRTVPFDAYHFTYLGDYTENELRQNGLKTIQCSDKRYPDSKRNADGTVRYMKFVYWVPNHTEKEYPSFKYVKENCTEWPVER